MRHPVVVLWFASGGEAGEISGARMVPCRQIFILPRKRLEYGREVRDNFQWTCSPTLSIISGVEVYS